MTWAFPGLLPGCSPESSQQSSSPQASAPEVPLLRAWSGIAEDGSRLLVEPLDQHLRATPSREGVEVFGELDIVRESGLLGEQETALQVTWISGAEVTSKDWRQVQVTTPVGLFRRFEVAQLDSLLAEMSEADAARLRLYWYGVVQGEYLSPLEQATGLAQSTPLLSQHHCLLHGPDQALSAEASLTGNLGGRSIMLQPRKWTPRQRRQFLEGTAPSSDE